MHRLALLLVACNVPLQTFTPITPGQGDSDYVKASNTGTMDRFGLGLAVSDDGTTLVVGANGEASGIVGNQDDNSVPNAGAAYVYARAGNAWTQEAYLKASNPGATDEFGLKVAVSSDGSTIAVGSYHESSGAMGVNGNQNDESKARAGAVYVFRRSGTTWTQEAYIKASNTDAMDFFGWSVALSSDGSTLAVGARHEDSASVSINNNQLNNSATDAGAAYVFTRQDTTWSQQAYIKCNETGAAQELGRAVALSADGSLLAVSAPGTGTVASAGAVYVFTRNGTTWSQQAALRSPTPMAGDQFGEQLAVTYDGTALAIGAPYVDGAGIDRGAVYVFQRMSTSWLDPTVITPAITGDRDVFGIRVAMSGDGAVLAVGAAGEASPAIGINGDATLDTAPDAGAVYIFTRDPTWSQRSYVKASNTEKDDRFGEGLALAGDGLTLAVAAWQEDSAATGINGDQTNNNAAESGAVYVYTMF